MALLEAMATHVPDVVWRRASRGFRRSSTTVKTAGWFRRRQSTHVRAAIIEAIRNSEAAQCRARRAYQDVLRDFSAAGIARSVAAVYPNIVADRT